MIGDDICDGYVPNDEVCLSNSQYCYVHAVMLTQMQCFDILRLFYCGEELLEIHLLDELSALCMLKNSLTKLATKLCIHLLSSPRERKVHTGYCLTMFHPWIL